MFRQKKQRIFRTGLHTLRIPVTEVAFKWCFNLLMEEDGTKRTRDDTLLTGNTLFTVNIVDAILCRDGSGRAVLHTFGYLALPADNRHPDDRVRVDHHDPNRTFLRIVYSETINGTDKLTNLAPGTSFGHYSQLPGHIFLLFRGPSGLVILYFSERSS